MSALAHTNRDDEKTKISLRAAKSLKEMISQAARSRSQSMTEFMLDASRRAAEDALLDQRLFSLDEEQWQRFNEALDAPIPDASRLRDLLAMKPVWEK